MSGLLQLLYPGQNRTGVEKEVAHSSPRVDTVEVKGFCLNDVWGPICNIWKVTIPPFGTVCIHGNTSVRGHCMWIHILAEPMPDPQLPTTVVPTVTFSKLHLGSSQVPICLCNLSAHSLKIPTKMVVGQVMPANQVPMVALPTVTSEESIGNPHKGWILEALNLQGLREWPKLEQEQVRELMLQWEHLLACSDLDHGRTALIKHKIEVTDQTPFKECYQCIPLHMYDDLKAHLQEMLDNGAIQKLHSLGASAVVLVWKKDGSLRFCIDLGKLNNQTLKDAKLLPHIDETLGSLQGYQWFSSLDLKLGYWQIKMEEESKPLIAFTVGLLASMSAKGCLLDSPMPPKPSRD